MRTKEKEYRIPVKIYDLEIVVVVTSDIRQSRNARADILGGPLELLYVDALTSSHAGNLFLFIQNDTAPCIIIHELFHITHRMLEYVDITFTPDNHEPFAYLQSFLFNKMIEKVPSIKKSFSTIGIKK